MPSLTVNAFIAIIFVNSAALPLMLPRTIKYCRPTKTIFCICTARVKPAWSLPTAGLFIYAMTAGDVRFFAGTLKSRYW
jgi:hypothetical protein